MGVLREALRKRRIERILRLPPTAPWDEATPQMEMLELYCPQCRRVCPYCGKRTGDVWWRILELPRNVPISALLRDTCPWCGKDIRIKMHYIGMRYPRFERNARHYLYKCPMCGTVEIRTERFICGTATVGWRVTK